MKLLICSDIHGDYDAAKQVIDIFENEGCDRLIILGDLLYHGPRNDLPRGYAPKKLIPLLNSLKDKITTVRGNCDAEVDGMVLDFPVLVPTRRITADGVKMLLTHGHKYNSDNPPRLKDGEIMLHGHTHIAKIEKFGNGNIAINPGSVSIPKDSTGGSYVIFDNGCFTAFNFAGDILFSHKV